MLFKNDSNILDLVRITVGLITQTKSSVTWPLSVLAGLKKQLGSTHRLPVPARDGQGYQQIPLC